MSICIRSQWGPTAWQPFTKAVLLVRDPDKSILAEFNRQSGGHVGFASPDRYRRTKGRCNWYLNFAPFAYSFTTEWKLIIYFADWQQFVTNKLWAWEQMNLQWAKNFTGDVHIVYFEDLVQNVDGTLRGILEFLHFPINEVFYVPKICKLWTNFIPVYADNFLLLKYSWWKYVSLVP